MPGKIKDKKIMLSSPWMWLFVASLFVGGWVLSHSLGRLTDCDDAWAFYQGGMRDWPEILSKVILRPENPAFLFGTWRPFAIYFITKLQWLLGLSIQGNDVLFWFIYWLAALSFSWGIISALSLGVTLAPSAVWAAATAFWWSAPSMVMSTTPLPGVFMVLFGGLAVGLSCHLGKGRQRWFRGALAVFCAYASCQTHENGWFILTWYGVWLAILSYLRLTKADSPKFWWPLLAVFLHMAIYRSFSPASYNRPDFSLNAEVGTVRAAIGYFFLAIFNGMAEPLPRWLGVTAFKPLDTTAASFPFAFLLTIGAVASSLIRPRMKAPKSKVLAKQEVAWKFATLTLLGIMVVTTAPYWAVNSHRFIYFARLAGGFFAVWLVAQSSRGTKVRALPVVLLVTANAAASVQGVMKWNWLDNNGAYCRAVYQRVMARHPELKECTSEKPCCVRFNNQQVVASEREGVELEWGRNAFLLSWLSGAPKRPPYIPEGWPGASCVKHVTVID